MEMIQFEEREIMGEESPIYNIACINNVPLKRGTKQLAMQQENGKKKYFIIYNCEKVYECDECGSRYTEKCKFCRHMECNGNMYINYYYDKKHISDNLHDAFRIFQT
jgi:hypothetical protein